MQIKSDTFIACSKKPYFLKVLLTASGNISSHGFVNKKGVTLVD